MKNLKFATLFAVAAIAAAALTTQADAACTNSQWTKTSGDGLASTIKGRLCGNNMSVRLIGLVDTGWISMNNTGVGRFGATYVDDNVTTKIDMQTKLTVMTVKFTHEANDGAISTTQSDYTLDVMN